MFLFPLFLLTGFLLDFHDSQWKRNPRTVNLKLLQNVLFSWILQSDVDHRAMQYFEIPASHFICRTFSRIICSLSLPPPFPVFRLLNHCAHCGIHSPVTNWWCFCTAVTLFQNSRC